MAKEAEEAVLPRAAVGDFLRSSIVKDSAAELLRATARAFHTRIFGRILLVDADAKTRAEVGKLLADEGWEVDEAGDSETALRSFRRRLPDLVIVDAAVQGPDGRGFVTELRADEGKYAVPILLLSGPEGAENSREEMKRGAGDYLVKPFSPSELLSRVAARVKSVQERAHLVAGERMARVAAEADREELSALFMQMPVAICILEGPEHTFTFANPAYRAFLNGKEVVGKTLFEALPEARGQGFDELMDQVMATGIPFVCKEAPGKVDRRGTGELDEIYFNYVYSPKRNALGKVDGVFVCSSEVTEQVLARKRVEALLEERKLADHRKDEFLAMLAHELRNPVAAIDLALNMLDQVEGDAAKASKHRDTAKRQVRHLVRLVDDLLDVSRITRGTVDLRLEEVDLAAVVDHATNAVRPLIEARGHELFVTVAGGFRARADAARIEQVLVNLLTNAAKYTEPGGAVSLRLGREVVDGVAQAVFRVRDTGRGIPRDMLDKVFEVFVQVSPTIDRSLGGLGLGLTLVKQLVEMHGGSVSAHSDGPARGSEIVVRLPLIKATPNLASALPEVAGPPLTVARKRRVVLVEDSADVRETLGLFLEYYGHEVVLAADGLDGAARILEVRPDVALVDIGLPNIDGYEVARRVRSGGGDKLFLVALTGYGGPDATAAVMAAGFDLHLTKPVETAELLQIVSGAWSPSPNHAG